MKNNNQRMIKKLQQVLFNLYDFQNGELKLNRKSQIVQDMILDIEEVEIELEIVNDCEHIEEFVSRMSKHSDLVKHFPNDKIDEIVRSTWNDYWEENRP